MVQLGARRRLQLDQPFDAEVVGAEDVDPLAVREMELDPLLRGPLQAVEAELRPVEPVVRRTAVRAAEDDQGRVPGVQVGTVDEALDFLKELERSNA